MLALGFIVAAIGGFIQGVTGFGAGVVLMLALPVWLAVPQAAGVSGAVCVAVTASIAWRYRAHIDPKAIVGPAALYVLASSVSITIEQGLDQNAVKVALGLFLVALAAYSLLVPPERVPKPRGAAAVACIAVSGVCDGMFGIGGPLMVLYYLSRTSDTERYLGTIQGFFFLTLVCATVFRAATGVLSPGLVPLIACGIAGVVVGASAAGRVVNRLDARIVRTLTYAVIGMAGIVTAAGALLG